MNTTNQLDLDKRILSDIVVHTKYARHLEKENRRENWLEIVTRNKDMHVRKYPMIAGEIEDVYNKFVLTKRVLPSMRSMQFGGRPIEINNSRIYNCAFLPIDSIYSFSETMFLLLGGTGVGYSVQTHHIENLPEIHKPNYDRKRKYVIQDSIIGWADAVKVLFKSYTGKINSHIQFDYSDIREKGALLITAGGRAPGPEPLRLALTKLEGMLREKEDNSSLSSLEAHDIMCHIADAVLAGGIRRAAMIALFNLNDSAMLSCKIGDWYIRNPQRGRANNSAVILRHKITKSKFHHLWERMKASKAGEPGIYFTNDMDWGTNPCAEISLRSNQFCNLTEINMSSVNGQEDFNQRAKAAAFIGTLQGGYTDFHYLRDVWARTTEKDALLGVSMTGIASKGNLLLDYSSATHVVNDENKRVAEIIGINPAARTTSVKPAGCQIPSTKIRTTDGDMSLYDIFKKNGIELNDKLNEYREWYDVNTDIKVYDDNGNENSITKLFINGTEETVKFTMEDGSIIECTPHHKFMMSDGTWKQAIDITEDDDWHSNKDELKNKLKEQIQ